MFNIFKKKEAIDKCEPLIKGTFGVGKTRKYINPELHFDLGETNKEASDFYLECEKSLFKIIIGVFERQVITSRLIDNEGLIDNLYAINNNDLNNELDKFKKLPPKIQQAILIGLENRLREY